MGTITFPEDQLKSITEQILTLPVVINGNPVENITGLVDALAAAIQNKDNLLKQDLDQEVFFNNAKLAIDQYHTELVKLNGTQKTNYNPPDLQSSAKHDLPHYDKTTWFNAVIEIIPSNNGNPITSNVTPNEITIGNSVKEAISEYVTGISSSSPLAGATLAANYTTGDTQIELDSSGGVIGDFLFIGNGTSLMILEITDNTNAPIYNTTPIFNEANYVIGDTATTEFSGYTNAERGRQVTIPPEKNSVIAYFEGNILTALIPYENNLLDQSTILATQISSGDNTKVTENTTAKDVVDGLISDYNTWDALPITDPSGKWTNDSLVNIIEANIDSRINTGIGTRVSEINTFLGSVSQTPDGAVSGSGAYLNLVEIIKTRIDLVGGTLAGFFQADLAISAIQSDIDTKNSTLDRYESFFAVGRILGDTELGQITFDVENASEFSASNQVKVFDNQSVVFIRNIDTIVGNSITLDSGIPAILTVSNLARIVREK